MHAEESDAVTHARATDRWTVLRRAAAAVAVGAVFWMTHLPVAASYPNPQQVWLVLADPLIGLACLFFVLRFSLWHPPTAAVVASAAMVLSEFAVGAAIVGLVVVSESRRWVHVAVAALAFGVATAFSGAVYPSGGARLGVWVQLSFTVLTIVAIIAIGVGLGQRRALVAGLRDRAESAEREQMAREHAARVAERNRIAHEMHDVLAHRISLVALHAGALDYRADLSEDERRAAIAAVDENARAALVELRDVLGVLRDPDSATGRPEPPQPGVDGIPTLIADGQGAGMTIGYESTVAGVPPSIASQAAYRVVREALSNARKHASGAAVIVSLAGEVGEGLAVVVTNGAPSPSAPSPLPGSGLGLVAMSERVEAIGGRLSAVRTEVGGFALTAWIPWST